MVVAKERPSAPESFVPGEEALSQSLGRITLIYLTSLLKHEQLQTLHSNKQMLSVKGKKFQARRNMIFFIFCLEPLHFKVTEMKYAGTGQSDKQIAFRIGAKENTRCHLM